MTLSICCAQLNFVVGDLAGNLEKIRTAAQHAHERGARVLLTPELALCGYAAEAGAGLLVVLNASPFHGDKQAEREAMLAARARETGVPVVYVHMVGGQDELVFDGGSFALQATGGIAMRAPAFEEALPLVEVLSSVPGSAAAPLRSLIRDPYLANPIGRASPTMAECVTAHAPVAAQAAE